MSATMLDSFDSPMLDYQNDHDISMQNNSDPWYHGEEHVMEDAGHDNGSHGGSHGSIEVEMEGFEDDENPEYEMVDTEDAYGHQTHESIEMEMYEASHNPSPYHSSLAIPDDTTQASTATTADFIEVSKLSTPLLLSPKLSADEHTMAASPLPFSDIGDHSFITETQPDLPSPVSIPVPLAFDENSGQEDLSGSSVVDDQHLQQPLPDAQDVATSTDFPATVVEEDPEGTIPSVQLASLQREELNEPKADHNLHNTAGYVHQIEVSSTSVVAERLDNEEPHGDTEHHHEQNMENNSEGVNHEHTSSAASSGDPHEISEGVYIDPPPPVMMSFAAEIPSVTLFNVASDSPGTSSSAEPIIMLADQPTLYYEPLSSVFEALRQDQHIQNIPDLLNGELGLEALDLELIMSEDYTFSQEVTLHDLNVLHDGLRKPGPLRVHLRRVGPKFLDKYHALQLEVERLELAATQSTELTVAPHEGQDQDQDDVLHTNRDDHYQKEYDQQQVVTEIQSHAYRDQGDQETDHVEPEAYEEDDIPPPPEDDEDDQQLTEDAGQTESAPEISHDSRPSAEDTDSNRNIEQHPDEVDEQSTVTAEGTSTDDAVHDHDQGHLDEESSGLTASADEVTEAGSGPHKPVSIQDQLDESRHEDVQDVPQSVQHADELIFEFEEIPDDDDESGTLSDEPASEHASVDNAAATFQEDFQEQDWEETYQGDDNTVATHQEEFLLEEPFKLHRAQSFGNSKRSISEAELEDFDDGETTLTGSPGSKRLRKE